MLDYLKISGTHFETGVALGRFGADAVHRHLLRSSAWHTVMQWRGTPQAQAMTQLVQQRHPGYWQELAGMAAGLALPLEDVFLWNCRGDVWSMAPDGCTTVQVPGESVRRVAHNEDGDPGFAGACAIGEITVEGNTRFASFLYPGSLPGHTFAVSDSGLAMTVNNLRARHIGIGVPRMILTRAMLDQPDLESAQKLLHTSPRAGGFHLTLMHRSQPTLLSVEFTSQDCSVLPLRAASLHANHMVHPRMRDMPQIVTGSSGYRQMAGARLLAAGTDPLGILRNQDNPVFPIYRDAADDSDHENTMATADLLLHADRIEWTVYADRTATPQYKMTDGHQSTPAQAIA